MKVVIENMIASCAVEGDLNIAEVGADLPGARYQPEVFRGVTVIREDPGYKSFIMEDGTIKFHGLTSEEGLNEALKDLLSEPSLKGVRLKDPLSIQEIIASVDLGGPVDAKLIYEEFKDDGVIYDPSELPGFILSVGKSGIEVLIFPEGKIITRGAKDIMNAVSSLQMVHGRISER